MRIHTCLKWGILFCSAYLYVGQAQAQFRVELVERTALAGRGDADYNQLIARIIELPSIDIPDIGSIPPGRVRYECSVGEPGHALVWTRCENIYEPDDDTYRLMSLQVEHGLNEVHFRAIAEWPNWMNAFPAWFQAWIPPWFQSWLQTSIFGPQTSAHATATWFVDARTEPVEPLFEDGGNVLAVPGPDGNCAPVVVPIRLENGAHLSYRVGTGPVVVVEAIPYAEPEEYPYMTDYNLVLTGHSLNAGQSLELYAWISTERFGNRPLGPTDMWTVLCPGSSAADLSVSILSPEDNTRLLELTEVTGTAEPGSALSLVLSQGATIHSIACGQAGADGSWRCGIPAENIVGTPIDIGLGTWQATATAILGGRGGTATVTFHVLDVLPLVDIEIVSPANGEEVQGLSAITGTAEPGSHIALELSNGTTHNMDCGTADAQGEWACTVPLALDEGAWRATVTATLLGATGTDAVDFRIVLPPPQPVALAILSPTQNAQLQSLLAVTGTAEPGSHIALELSNGTTHNMDCGTADAQGEWTCTVPLALDEGAWRATVTATLLGATGTDAVDFRIVFPPDGPSVTPPVALAILSPTQNAQLQSLLAVTGTAEPGSHIALELSSTSAHYEVDCSTADVAGNWLCAIPNALAFGQWEATVTATVGAQTDTASVGFFIIETGSTPLTREHYIVGGTGCSSTSGAPLALLALGFWVLARRRRQT